MSVTKTRTSTLWGAALDWAVPRATHSPLSKIPWGLIQALKLVSGCGMKALTRPISLLGLTIRRSN